MNKEVKLTYQFLRKKTDTLIYGFVGPFAVLYIFPQFFLRLEKNVGIECVAPLVLDILGTAMMWIGAILALWCGAYLLLNKGGSINGFASPKKIVTTGPYSIVRHPMMWALHIVIVGEILVFTSPALVIWFFIWLRVANIYVSRYEEPMLKFYLGSAYTQYCKKTPRWVPIRKKKDTI